MISYIIGTDQIITESAVLILTAFGLVMYSFGHAFSSCLLLLFFVGGIRLMYPLCSCPFFSDSMFLQEVMLLEIPVLIIKVSTHTFAHPKLLRKIPVESVTDGNYSYKWLWLWGQRWWAYDILKLAGKWSISKQREIPDGSIQCNALCQNSFHAAHQFEHNHRTTVDPWIVVFMKMNDVLSISGNRNGQFCGIMGLLKLAISPIFLPFPLDATPPCRSMDLVSSVHT